MRRTKLHMPLDLYLLPHQDDELGAFHLIESAAQQRSCLVVYLTDGAFGRTSAATRDAESTNVLSALGLARENICFLGRELSVSNQRLSGQLDTIHDELIARLSAPNIEVGTIYVPAWEGGHPDHDAAALLAMAVAHSLDLRNNVFQFPLYNAYKCKRRPFRVLTPIREAGESLTQKIPVDRRFSHLRLCWRYPSQLRTFIGLFPFIALHYLLRGTQQLQALKPATLAARPHKEPLLYERRGWKSFDDFEQDVFAFRQCHNLRLVDQQRPSKSLLRRTNKL